MKEGDYQFRPTLHEFAVKSNDMTGPAQHPLMLLQSGPQQLRHRGSGFVRFGMRAETSKLLTPAFYYKLVFSRAIFLQGTDYEDGRVTGPCHVEIWELRVSVCVTLEQNVLNKMVAEMCQIQFRLPEQSFPAL